MKGRSVAVQQIKSELAADISTGQEQIGRGLTRTDADNCNYNRKFNCNCNCKRQPRIYADERGSFRVAGELWRRGVGDLRG